MLDKLVWSQEIRHTLVSICLYFALVLLLPKFYDLFLAQNKIIIFPKQPVYLWLFSFK